MPKDLIYYLTFSVTVVILIYNILSNYAIRGNELKHLSGKIDDVIKRIERLENRIFENKK